jgi:hypothetical protein
MAQDRMAQGRRDRLAQDRMDQDRMAQDRRDRLQDHHARFHSPKRDQRPANESQQRGKGFGKGFGKGGKAGKGQQSHAELDGDYATVSPYSLSTRAPNQLAVVQAERALERHLTIDPMDSPRRTSIPHGVNQLAAVQAARAPSTPWGDRENSEIDFGDLDFGSHLSSVPRSLVFPSHRSSAMTVPRPTCEDDQAYMLERERHEVHMARMLAHR